MRRLRYPAGPSRVAVIDSLGTLVGQPQFRLGFIAGLVGLAVGVSMVPAWRRRSPVTALPAGGLLVGAATLVGIDRSRLRDDLAMGLLLLAALVAVSVAVVAHRHRYRWLPAVCSAPGAVVVAMASTRGSTSIPWLPLAAAVVVFGSLVADFESRHRHRGLGLVLLAVLAAGVYVTVPDTEAAAALLGAAAVLAVAGWPRALLSLGTIGSYVAVAAVLGVAADGGRTLGTSVLAAGACLGLLAAEPIAVRVARSGDRRHDPSLAGALPFGPAVVAQVAVVALASRVAGQTANTTLAAVVVAGDTVLAVGAAIVLRRRWATWQPRGPSAPGETNGRSGRA